MGEAPKLAKLKKGLRKVRELIKNTADLLEQVDCQCSCCHMCHRCRTLLALYRALARLDDMDE